MLAIERSSRARTWKKWTSGGKVQKPNSDSSGDHYGKLTNPHRQDRSSISTPVRPWLVSAGGRDYRQIKWGRCTVRVRRCVTRRSCLITEECLLLVGYEFQLIWGRRPRVFDPDSGRRRTSLESFCALLAINAEGNKIFKGVHKVVIFYASRKKFHGWIEKTG